MDNLKGRCATSGTAYAWRPAARSSGFPSFPGEQDPCCCLEYRKISCYLHADMLP